MREKRPNNSRQDKKNEPIFHVKEPVELMDFLLIHFKGKSRNAIKSILTHKQVSVNGKAVTQYNFPLKPEDEVSITKGKVIEEFKHPKIKVVYEDDCLMVIDKAAGLLTVSTNSGKKEQTAFNILLNYQKIKDPQNHLYVVHRIDRETSGLLMFAKNKKTQLNLQDNWHKNVTERVYIAVVEGVPEKDEDTIVSYFYESKALKVHSNKNDKDGQKAVTHYKIIRSNGNYSMLKFELETGRKNQIRVHAHDIGHPIVGDKKYGNDSSPIGRMCLHASVLAFIHPETGEEMRFESKIPAKFNYLF